MSDIKARLAAMYPAGQPNEYTLTLPKQALANTMTDVDPDDIDDDAQSSDTGIAAATAEDDVDQADTGEEPEPEPEAQREYFVRGIHDDRLTATQFNIRESMRWVTDHFSPPAQAQPEDVPSGHYASSEVSDEEFAEAYARHTGTPYRPRNYAITSHRPL